MSRGNVFFLVIVDEWLQTVGPCRGFNVGPRIHQLGSARFKWKFGNDDRLISPVLSQDSIAVYVENEWRKMDNYSFSIGVY